LAVYVAPPEGRALGDAPVELTYRVRALDPAFSLYSDGLAVDTGLPPGSPPSLMFDTLDARLVDPAADRWRLTASPGVARGGLRVRPDFGVCVRLTGDPAQVGRAYTVEFDSRAAIWKYLLIGDWTPQRPCIVVSGRTRPDLFADAFDPPAQPRQERLADGRMAIAVRSTQPIALTDRPMRKYEVWSRRDDGALADKLVAALPDATPASLAIETPGDPSTLVAEIFVPR
jgi:hypothetical protein